MNDKIEPTILKGTRDLLPEDMAARNGLLKTIAKTFEQFGYQPIETPILSKAETILGKEGGETSKMAYKFKDYGDRDIALPFDLTMPFARFVAANWQSLPMPFKRYQIQRVWRAENPQRGRLREFYQCDVDIIGTDNLLAEAEIAKLIERVFSQLKIKNIKIKINSRKLLNQVLSSYGVDESKLEASIRIIDKLDKIGESEVIKKLEELGVGSAAQIIEALTPADDNKDTLGNLKKFDTSEVEEFLSLADMLDVDLDKIVIDPSLARGLDYYTGLIFEVVSPGSNLGTICAGGRYDNLAGLFSKQEFSGVGVSFGFERIMILLDELGLIRTPKAKAETLVTVFDNESLPSALNIYNKLIEANLAAEIYLENAKLAKQLKYADKKKISFVIVQGPDEAEKDQVLVKLMASGSQKLLPLDQLVGYISGFYDATEE